MKEELQIELLRVTVLRTKLSLRFSLNDHMRSYITVLIEKGGVATAVRRVRNELNTDISVSRRDDTSLQSMATSTTAVREVEEDVIIRAVLLQLINITVFNLTFLMTMETAAAS
ncbi:hypothetical protein BDDG_02286 [Blastomyces dermatitidis ATCC 18188]|uniref:Uncharacterized protein n=1 Tax=Ajellomyces dermatitidis (strain ATCC 18188 / CBS 674.68) TaxID=653446 RepID=F2T7Y4_AJEDA|nr:hypothetical protein BDDG_02286 [Blastomyces dermatitidis ATCC 18188]